jgi:hypothetical protein
MFAPYAITAGSPVRGTYGVTTPSDVERRPGHIPGSRLQEPVGFGVFVKRDADGAHFPRDETSHEVEEGRLL